MDIDWNTLAKVYTPEYKADMAYVVVVDVVVVVDDDVWSPRSLVVAIVAGRVGSPDSVAAMKC